MTSDRLLTEIERQEKYLGQLPDNFEFPLFNSKQALESQRKNGYRDSASAAREIVDNSIEGGAKRIDIVFEHSKSENGKDLVTSIAFIDDGAGMLPKMIQYALSLGGGTHFDEPEFIGKFGFGLPNASINQTKRVEVYSKTQESSDLMRGTLDVTEYTQHGIQTIKPPEKSELPEFVQKHFQRKNLKFEHGTVVVWVQPDRLTYKTGAKLKEHLVDDFGITYRYLLDEVDIIVEGKRVEGTDPLFLNPEARYYLPPDENAAVDAGGATERFNRSFVIKHFIDPDTGINNVEKVEDLREINEKDPNLIAYGTVHVRVSRLPYGFAAKKGNDEHSKQRLEIRTNGRGISFVRAGREIETLKVLPHTERDKSAGLGSWLPLQSYDYHWACEITFKPELDEVFGITNDKQKVRPLEGFWRLLSKDDIGLDKALRDEHNWQWITRENKRKEKNKATIQEQTQPTDEPTFAESAAATVEIITGKTVQIPERDKNLIKIITEEKIDERVKVTNETRDEAIKALKDERNRRPYIITYFNDFSGAFYEPELGANGQVVVKINRVHPFFQAVYGTLLTIEGGSKAKESIDLLLIALAKAELTTEHKTTKLLYETQRKETWSPFLEKSLKVLEQKYNGTDIEIEIDDDTVEREPSVVAVGV